MKNDHEVVRLILEKCGQDFTDNEAGIPRRHFLRTKNGVIFRFEPDGSLSEVFPETD